MRHRLSAVAVVVALGLSSAMGGQAFATEKSDQRSDDETWSGPKRVLPSFPAAVEFGFSTGFSLPLGVATGAGPQSVNGTTQQTIAQDESALFVGRVPFVFDLGYRVSHLYFGLYAMYAIAFPANSALPTCNTSGAQCSGHGDELGLLFAYHVAPLSHVDPWVGLGVGVEWATVSTSVGSGRVDLTFLGYPAATLQVGADWKEQRQFAIGGFLGLSVSQYATLSASSGGRSVSTDIENETWHGWFTFGLRASYDFFLPREPPTDSPEPPTP